MKALILTDHSNHSSENSLYALAAELSKHAEVDIVSRKTNQNFNFFNCENDFEIWGTTVNSHFEYNSKSHPLDSNLTPLEKAAYDFIWLRIPPPIKLQFLHFVNEVFEDKIIINNPLAIFETGSKAFLMNFQNVCPPMKICTTIEDILEFSQRFPIVLKPFREFGGKGILKIEGDSVLSGNELIALDQFKTMFHSDPVEYLAVKYLKNVKEGDKRIIVIDGEIMGASLRLPPEDSWICNVAMGGTSHHSDVTEEEIQIVNTINPILKSKGIIMYGLDTLVGDDGKRVLSEINTTSIGGLPQMAMAKKLPLVEKGIEKIIQHVVKRQQNKKKMKDTLDINALNLDAIPAGKISRYFMNIVEDGMGAPIKVPLLIAKGLNKGPVFGLTAAVHGNELNGIPVIQRLFNEIDPKKINGTVIGVPIVNVPSYLRKIRRFPDGVDLNHIMPGNKEGTVSQVYAWRVVNKLVRHFDYLLDLHTASNGRINSYYIRADMSDETVRKMALLQNAQIIVHNPPSDGTLRGTADELEIPAITLEVGNPNLFQKGMIRDGLTGIYNLLGFLGMTDSEVEEISDETVICKKSYWIYSDMGGLMAVHPNVTDVVEKNDTIATLRNIFGDVIKEYKAPERGIVIGKSVSPVNQTGGRILHLGIIK